jgi:hypothetical protein
VYCSLAEAMRPAEPVMFNNGHYLIARGAIAAMCTHEAGHAVALFAMRRPLKSVEVRLSFWPWKSGGLVAAECGGATAIDDPNTMPLPHVAEFPELPSLVEDDNARQLCWRPFWNRAFSTLAGPAAEQKYRALNGLGGDGFARSDAKVMEWYNRELWNLTGRDGHAFARLIWRGACRFVDDPKVWRAIEKIDAALFSGLIWQEPPDPRPGDSIKFVLDGARAEALAAEAGVIRAEFHHDCTNECAAPRRPSRGWQAYLANWKKRAGSRKGAAGATKAKSAQE